MNSLTVNTSLICQSSSCTSTTFLVVLGPKCFTSVTFPRKPKKERGRLVLRVHAYDSSKNDSFNNDSSDSKPANGSLVSLVNLSCSVQKNLIMSMYIYVQYMRFQLLLVGNLIQELVIHIVRIIGRIFGYWPILASMLYLLLTVQL